MGAVVLTVLVGSSAGVATALMTEPPDRPRASTFNDPLHLGVPLVDLDCSGDSVLVVGWGESSAPLAAAVADNRDADVRYLRTDDSCPTQYVPDDLASVPEYVAYTGPFEDRAEPCRARMQVAHRGDFVTRLVSGNVFFVKCPCELPASEFPVLSVGMEDTPQVEVWVRALQGLLVDLKDGRYEESDVSGVYDERTAERIRPLQEATPGLRPDGIVDEDTWRAVRDRVCGSYTY